MNKIEFSKELIKGRIAEVVFEQLFRSTGRFTVIPFGYEYAFPELAQYQDSLANREVLDNIRTAPDFALISQDKKDVHLVEVKFRRSLFKQELLECANEQVKRWDPSYIFVASLDGLFFDSCESIIQKQGEVGSLPDSRVSRET